MAGHGVVLVVLWSWILQLGLGDTSMPYVLDSWMEKELTDDDNDLNRQALLKTRTRINATGLTKTYGVVMVATSLHVDYSVHTIPIWKAYCEKHGFDFFLQEESLSPGVRDHWTKPRVMLELAAQSKWKYIWLVDPNSLPVDFEKPWTYAIKAHMRKQRYKNDKQKIRVVWCPEDCEKSYGDKFAEGSCYGPFMSGCIFHNGQKAELTKILLGWYWMRKKFDKEDRGLKMGLTKVRETNDYSSMTESNYDRMLWLDSGMEMGRSDSTFLRTFGYDSDEGYNIRNQVVKTIGQFKALGNVLNKRGQHRPGQEL